MCTPHPLSNWAMFRRNLYSKTWFFFLIIEEEKRLTVAPWKRHCSLTFSVWQIFVFLLLSLQMAKINRREHTRQIKKLSSSRLTCASQHRNQSTLQQRWLVSACLSLSFHLVCSSAEAQIDWKHSTFLDPTLGQKRNENEGGPCLSVGMNGLPVYWCCLWDFILLLSMKTTWCQVKSEGASRHKWNGNACVYIRADRKMSFVWFFARRLSTRESTLFWEWVLIAFTTRVLVVATFLVTLLGLKLQASWQFADCSTKSDHLVTIYYFLPLF